MAVPAAPTAGEPIAEAWGDVVHDAVVANDVQFGRAAVPANGSPFNLTFPRPFASAPVILLTLESGSRNYGVDSGAVSTTGTQLVLRQYQSSALPTVPAVALTCMWLAIGPRA